MVGLFKVSESAADSAELRGYVEAHAAKTGSHRAQQLLADWDNAAPKFVKVRKERPAHAPHRAPPRAAHASADTSRLTPTPLPTRLGRFHCRSSRTTTRA